MPVIACASQMGARGEELAHDIAEAMGLDFIDRDAIAGAAVRAGVSERSLEDHPEGAPTLGEQIGAIIGRYRARRLEEPDTPMDEVVRELARRGNMVLIGQGAPYSLRRAPTVLSLYFCGSKQFRVEWLMGHEKCTQAEAERRLKANDRVRSEYVRQNWQMEWSNPAVYDLCINTDWYDAEGSVRLVRAALERLKR